jgi:hypothetical protein
MSQPVDQEWEWMVDKYVYFPSGPNTSLKKICLLFFCSTATDRNSDCKTNSEKR